MAASTPVRHQGNIVFIGLANEAEDRVIVASLLFQGHVGELFLCGYDLLLLFYQTYCFLWNELTKLIFGR